MSTPKRKRVCVVVTNRANYARIYSALAAIREHPKLELQLVVGASALLHRFGSAIDIIRSDGFDPVAVVHSVIEGGNPVTMAKTTGLTIIELSTVFENLRPDIVVTIADRYETLAVAVAANYMNILLAHVQGGEVTGSVDESVRHAISKLAHLHFPSTEKSARRLEHMGENPKLIFTVGCPSIDIARALDKNNPLKDLMKAYGGTGKAIDWERPFLLVLQHPVTTECEDGLAQINETIQAVDELRMQTIWLWPNVDAGSEAVAKGLRLYRENKQPQFVHFFRNLAPQDYLRLLDETACIVGNSSSGIREGSYFGTPCVNIGTRQQNRERASNVIDVAYESGVIVHAVKQQIQHGKHTPCTLFGDGYAGKRIANILAESNASIKKSMTY